MPPNPPSARFFAGLDIASESFYATLASSPQDLLAGPSGLEQHLEQARAHYLRRAARAAALLRHAPLDQSSVAAEYLITRKNSLNALTRS